MVPSIFAVAFLVLASTGDDDVTILPPPALGEILQSRATICSDKQDMLSIVTAERNGEDGAKVFNSLPKCDNLCINMRVVDVVTTFYRTNGDRYSVFELQSLYGEPNSFWASIPVDEVGKPLPINPVSFLMYCKEIGQE